MENENKNTIEANSAESPELEKRKTTVKDILLFILRIGIASAIIGWMITKNYPQLLKALEGFNYIWLLPAAIFYALHLFAGGWRWYLLLKVQKVKIKYHEALSLTMQGFFFSLVLPGGALGGDVVKGAFLVKRTPKGNKLTGTFTILIDRIIGMISLFSLAGVAGILSYQFLKNETGFMKLIVYALLFGCVTGVVSAIVLFFHRQLEKIPGITQILDFGDKLTRGAISKLVEAMDCFRSSWRTLISTILISIVLIHLTLSLVVYCIAGGLGVGELQPETYVLSTTLANAAAAIPATPAGVGTRDIVMEKIFVAAGVSAGDGVAIALIFTGIILIFNLAGGLFFILTKSHKNHTETVYNESPPDENLSTPLEKQGQDALVTPPAG